MTTSLIREYKAEEGYSITSVIIIDENTTAVLLSDYKKSRKIAIISDTTRIIDLDNNSTGFDVTSATSLFFRYRNGFGFIDYTDTLLLWETVDAQPTLLKIENPFKPDKHGRRHYCTFASWSETDDILYVGIEHISCFGFPARYYCKLTFGKTRGLFSSGKPKAEWGNLNELPLHLYPETKLRPKLEQLKMWDWYLLTKKSDWLNINGLLKKDDKLYIPTDGGELTRLKSGMRYEYSLISILSLENKLLNNIEIEEGHGRFSSCKRFYFLYPRKNKTKLLVYNITGFTIDFELSYKKMGIEPNYGIDIYNENLYLFNSTILQVRKNQVAG